MNTERNKFKIQNDSVSTYGKTAKNPWRPGGLKFFMYKYYNSVTTRNIVY